MTQKTFLFGYGRHGIPIAEGLKKDGHRLTIVESDETNFLQAKKDEYIDIVLVDITKDADLEGLMVEPADQLICVMDDEHLNVFLTLSLRSLFPKSYILSISDSIYASQKLEMAGADMVIDLYEVSANRIHNILNKPVATKLLYQFATSGGQINFRELIIPDGSFLHHKNVESFDFRAYGVILVGLIDREKGDHFIFITSGYEHKLDIGDTIVVLGENMDLEKFQALIAQNEVT